MHDNF